MASVQGEKLILTLPPDPALARLTRLVALHFLRQHGVKALEARRSARKVEERSRAVLRAAARAGRGSSSTVKLTLTSNAKALEAVLRSAARQPANLLRINRQGHH